MNLKSQGVSEEELNESIDRMAELAFEDDATANPKEALISEIKKDIIQTSYYYKQ